MRQVRSSVTPIVLLFAIFAGQLWWVAAGGYRFYSRGGLLGEFDTLLHVLGGAWAALFALRYAPLGVTFRNVWWRFVGVIAFVALVAVLWELYEFGVDEIVRAAARVNQPDLADTMLDIAAALVGGSVTMFLAGRGKTEARNR